MTDEQVIAEASPDGILGKVLGKSDRGTTSAEEWAWIMSRNISNLLSEDIRRIQEIQNTLYHFKERDFENESWERDDLRKKLAKFEGALENHITIMRQLPVAARIIMGDPPRVQGAEEGPDVDS